MPENLNRKMDAIGSSFAPPIVSHGRSQREPRTCWTKVLCELPTSPISSSRIISMATDATSDKTGETAEQATYEE